MKKISLIFLILCLLVGCDNKSHETKMNCLLELESDNYSESFEYSLSFYDEILESYSFNKNNKNYYSPKKFDMPIKVSDFNSLKEDDIIGFYSSDKKSIYVHRIIKIIEKNNQISYVTKYDENNSPDLDLVLQNEVLFKTTDSIKQIDKKDYEYVKNFFEENGYICK